MAKMLATEIRVGQLLEWDKHLWKFMKGSTVTTSFKPAIVETGLQILVPPFVNKGEKIKINTDSGEYMERA